jgi:F-type H+-transporting ATPase subunit b
MLIDWFTVAAQVVNFLILVWLLKRFLYRPILSAIDAREKSIAAQIAQAAAERSKAQAERSSYEAKNRELAAERERLLAAARKAAEEERGALLQQARTENAQLRERLNAELLEHREEMTRAIGAQLESDLLETARRLVVDLSDRPLEEAILNVFVRRLHALSDADRERLARDLAGSAGGVGTAVTLRTAFEASAEQRAAVDSALKQIVPTVGVTRYERAPELIGGVELEANGHRLSWSMESYLDALREKVDGALKSAAET